MGDSYCTQGTGQAGGWGSSSEIQQVGGGQETVQQAHLQPVASSKALRQGKACPQRVLDSE